MKIKAEALTPHDLYAAVQKVSDEQYAGNLTFKRHPSRSGNFYNFTLTVLDSSKPGARRSPSGRRIAAACWHAHRDVLRLIFERFKDAKFVSAVETYDGHAEFHRNFEETGDRNIGSQMEPCAHADACECEA